MESGQRPDRWARNLAATVRRRELKERAVRYLGGMCEICRYDRCVSAFDFHHPDPRVKDFNISSKTSWASIVPELIKCHLLCSNCHREVHAGLHPSFLKLDDRFDSDEDDEPAQDPSPPPELWG